MLNKMKAENLMWFLFITRKYVLENHKIYILRHALCLNTAGPDGRFLNLIVMKNPMIVTDLSPPHSIEERTLGKERKATIHG